MGREIERKFHLDRVPDQVEGRGPGHTVAQGYLALHGDGTEVRIRRRGDRCTVTVKSGGGLSRLEVELDVDAERFCSLWPLTKGRRIRKRRSTVPLGNGLLAELDVYEGELEGLVLAEVEFETVADSVSFQPPPWLGREVTGDPDYLNQSLAVNGRPRQRRGTSANCY